MRLIGSHLGLGLGGSEVRNFTLGDNIRLHPEVDKWVVLKCMWVLNHNVKIQIVELTWMLSCNEHNFYERDNGENRVEKGKMGPELRRGGVLYWWCNTIVKGI